MQITAGQTRLQPISCCILEQLKKNLHKICLIFNKKTDSVFVFLTISDFLTYAKIQP